MPRKGENVRKRKDGRWEGRYYIYDQTTHTKKLRSVYAKTYSEVKKKMLISRANILNCKNIPENPNEIQLKTAADAWLNSVQSSKKHSTYIKYKTIFDKYIHPYYGKINLTTCNQKQLNVILCQISGMDHLSESMKKSIVCILNQILRYASVTFSTPHFKVEYCKSKHSKVPVEVLNRTEMMQLLQFLNHDTDRHKLGILICVYTGLRLGEICALKWSDIDVDNRVIHVNRTVQRISQEGHDTKTILLETPPKSVFSKREIPMPDELFQLMLAFYDQRESYVIGSNKPMEPRTYQNKFKRYLKQAGIGEKNFHILRHTFATNCVHGGMDIKCLSEILGHSDVKITLNRYVHPSLEIKRKQMNTLLSIYGQISGQKIS